MPGGAAVDRRAPARDADRRHAARAHARARRSATRLIVAFAWCVAGHRRRPPRRRYLFAVASVQAVLTRRRPPPSAGSRSATSGSPGRPRAQADARTCSTPSARCAACSSTRPRSSRATTCSCCSSRHGAFDETLFERARLRGARAVRVLGARGVATCSARTCRSTATRCRPPEGGAWRTAHERVVGRRGASSARTSSSGSTEEGPLRARDIEDRATGRRGSRRGWTHARNVARMLDLMWVRGARRHLAAARAPSASGT